MEDISPRTGQQIKCRDPVCKVARAHKGESWYSGGGVVADFGVVVQGAKRVKVYEFVEGLQGEAAAGAPEAGVGE